MKAIAIDDLRVLKYPLLASPKLNGVRVLGPQGEGEALLHSLKGKPIPNKYCQQLYSCLSDFDGELIVGPPTAPDCYRQTVSGVMSIEGEPNVIYHAFDLVLDILTFEERLLAAELRAKSHERVKVLPHVTIKNEEELLRYEEVQLGKGYEGVILRDPKGPYKYGRSTVKEGWLYKLKRFLDSEAVITGVFELNVNKNKATLSPLGYTERTSHKANKHGAARLGAIGVTDVKSGVEFQIGAGFSAEERLSLWVEYCNGGLLGKVVTYKYFPLGSKEKPRHPVFKGFRDPIDLD
jgi:DNA ligase-1